MSEPSVTPGEWLALVVTSMLAGMGSAMAWFSNSKKELNTRMTNIDGPQGRMACYEESHALLDKQIAVVETCQENTANTLVELKGLHKDMNQKLDDVLKEIRRS